MNETEAKANAMWDTLVGLGYVDARGGYDYGVIFDDVSRVLDFAAAAERIAECVAWIDEETGRS